jgi:hypothetical protein
LRWSIIQELVVSGMTTAGYSLPWERWMVTAWAEELADLRAEQRPDCGDEFRAASFGCDPGDRVPGFGVGEGDPLEDSIQDRAAVRPGHHHWREDNLSPGPPS